MAEAWADHRGVTLSKLPLVVCGEGVRREDGRLSVGGQAASEDEGAVVLLTARVGRDAVLEYGLTRAQVGELVRRLVLATAWLPAGED